MKQNARVVEILVNTNWLNLVKLLETSNQSAYSVV